MFRQLHCHPQGVFIKQLQVLTAYKYTIFGFTVEVFTQLTMLKYIYNHYLRHNVLLFLILHSIISCIYIF
jgi:hypothetical protein